LDAPITASEIESVIAKLQNNKAAGVDNITNEYIKFTLYIMLPIYTTIFNLVFDGGVIPESWSIGVINPIFKNKGNRKDPANYRSITLVSSLSYSYSTRKKDGVITIIGNTRFNIFIHVLNNNKTFPIYIIFNHFRPETCSPYFIKRGFEINKCTKQFLLF
jgi:hypothetical protein